MPVTLSRRTALATRLVQSYKRGVRLGDIDGVALGLMAASLGLGGACDSDTGDRPVVPIACACDDGDDCTDDICLADGRCAFVGKDVQRACLVDVHCASTGPCLVGRCEPVEGCGFLRCALSARECDDQDPCTLDRCEAGAGCVAERLDAGGACVVDGDCDDGRGCTRDFCEVVEGCGRFCSSESIAGCMACATASDCGFPCQSSACVEQACVYGPHEPRCDYRCFNPGSSTPDDDDASVSFRGLAAPRDEDCDACPCARDLVLRGPTRDLTLTAGSTLDNEPWGTCRVDTCGGATSCSPLRAHRGYLVQGGESLATAVADGQLIGPYRLRVDYYCLAVHSDLMLGRWRVMLAVDGAAVIASDAIVASADPGPTRVVLTGTDEGVGIPPQTLLLPNGGFRLETSIETGVGRFSGAVFSGPAAIEGDLTSPDGTRALLTLTPDD